MTRAEMREKDPEAYRQMRRKERAKYRAETGTRPDGAKTLRAYTEDELKMIISSEYTDRELAKLMGRSVIAIQNKRTRMRNDGWYIKYKGEENK